MNTLAVCYDLNAPGKDYAKLIDAIKGTTSDWWHCLDSMWIVKTSLTAEQLRDRLQAFIDSSDELLVIKVSAPAAWVGFDENCSAWLLNNL